MTDALTLQERFDQLERRVDHMAVDLQHTTASMSRIAENVDALLNRFDPAAAAEVPMPIVRISDVTTGVDDHQNPRQIIFSLRVSVANVGSTPTTVKAFHICFQGDLALRAPGWAEEADTRTREGGVNLGKHGMPRTDGRFIHADHALPSRTYYHGETQKKYRTDIPLKLDIGDFVGPLVLDLVLVWESEGADDGTRYDTVAQALLDGDYVLRAALSDGSFAYWPKQ